MAVATDLRAEDSLLCSICLSIFTKPVSIPCGHNFCYKCISDYWDTVNTIFQCPLCKEKYHPRPILHVNSVIAQMVEIVKTVQGNSSCKLEQTRNGNMLCGICTGANVRGLTAGEPKQRMTEMDTFSKEKLHEARSALKKTEEELKSVTHSLTEMETFFKEKLSEARSALTQKEEELKTVIDRLASEDVVSTNVNDPDGMKNPVSKSRLTGFYHQLKLLRWPQIKDHLKSNNITPKFTTVLIQKMFKAATDEMEKKKEQIEEVFGPTETGSGQTPQKVKEQKQLAIHNLQMSLYHSSKEDLLKTLLCDYEAHYSEDVMVQLRLLASECYWLGCLLALNNPPLQLDWQNHIPGMDGWDIFPRDMKTSVN